MGKVQLMVPPCTRVCRIDFGHARAGCLFFDWIAVALVILVHTGLFIWRVVDEGRDINHMNIDRLNGRRGHVFVTPTYHALHHVYPEQHFSSFLSLFDVVFGTNRQIKGQRILVTGASGAYGQALTAKLEKLGAVVDTAKFGEDYEIDNYDGLSQKKCGKPTFWCWPMAQNQKIVGPQIIPVLWISSRNSG